MDRPNDEVNKFDFLILSEVLEFFEFGKSDRKCCDQIVSPK